MLRASYVWLWLRLLIDLPPVSPLPFLGEIDPSVAVVVSGERPALKLKLTSRASEGIGDAWYDVDGDGRDGGALLPNALPPFVQKNSFLSQSTHTPHAQAHTHKSTPQRTGTRARTNEDDRSKAVVASTGRELGRGHRKPIALGGLNVCWFGGSHFFGCEGGEQNAPTLTGFVPFFLLLALAPLLLLFLLPHLAFPGKR